MKKEDWKNYVIRIKDEIKDYSRANKINLAIVGVYGSYLRKRENRLRVYVNGGKAMEIPLSVQGKFSFCDSYLSEKGENGEWLYFTQEDYSKISKIIESIEEKKEALDKDDFKLLRNYLDIISKATSIKFGKLEKSINNEEKERCQQIKLYNTISEKRINDIDLFDIEFQSVFEMNFTDKEQKEFIKSHKDKRKVHCAKPDYLAVTSDGFALVELKTNEKALRGDAGVLEHNRDIDKLILVNNENHILARELIARLKIAKEYKIIEGKHVDNILGIAEKDLTQIKIEKAFIFKTNADLTEEMCNKYIEKMHIENNSYVI